MTMDELLVVAAADHSIPLEDLLAQAREILPDDPPELLMEELGVARDPEGFGVEP